MSQLPKSANFTGNKLNMEKSTPAEDELASCQDEPILEKERHVESNKSESSELNPNPEQKRIKFGDNFSYTPMSEDERHKFLCSKEGLDQVFGTPRHREALHTINKIMKTLLEEEKANMSTPGYIRRMTDKDITFYEALRDYEKMPLPKPHPIQCDSTWYEGFKYSPSWYDGFKYSPSFQLFPTDNNNSAQIKSQPFQFGNELNMEKFALAEVELASGQDKPTLAKESHVESNSEPNPNPEQKPMKSMINIQSI